MINKNITEARSSLYQLIDQVCEEHEPIFIKGKRGSAVLISEEDWRSIKETLHLMSVPGMVASIKEGRATPTNECDEELKW